MNIKDLKTQQLTWDEMNELEVSVIISEGNFSSISVNTKNKVNLFSMVNIKQVKELFIVLRDLLNFIDKKGNS